MISKVFCCFFVCKSCLSVYSSLTVQKYVLLKRLLRPLFSYITSTEPKGDCDSSCKSWFLILKKLTLRSYKRNKGAFKGINNLKYNLHTPFVIFPRFLTAFFFSFFFCTPAVGCSLSYKQGLYINGVFYYNFWNNAIWVLLSNNWKHFIKTKYCYCNDIKFPDIYIVSR